ncbi:MAG: sensor histidine kinase, partial [Chitinophagales bacterium]
LILTYLNVYLLYSSYFDLPLGERILKCFLPELLLLPVKAGFTYYVMYRFLPVITKRKNLVLRSIELFFIFLMFLFLYRIVLFEVIYRYINMASSFPQQTFLQEVPRYIYRALDIFTVVGLASMIKMFRQALRFTEKEKQHLREKSESELIFLRSQTNPHFLFNILNGIYVMARKKSDETAETVMRLSKLLRFMLYECKKEKIFLKDEIQLIQDYIELEKTRYDHRLEVKFTKYLENTSAEITPLLLLPLVENAFKHGVSETTLYASILCDITERNNTLHLRILNAKNPEVNAETSGLGLSNIKRQLALLYTSYDLSLQNREHEFETNLKIDLDSYAKNTLFNS